MEKHKTCSFFGHRKINITTKIKLKLTSVIKNLIINHNVTTFIFGSRSEFNYLCHYIVTQLKNKYPNIQRICYTCRSESCTLESDRIKLEEIYSYFEKREVHLLGYEKEFEHKTKYSSCKASYVERNEAMIDDSDYCVFYYDVNYLPEKRKLSPKSVNYYQPKSGTSLSYKYATKKGKVIINIFEN